MPSTAPLISAQGVDHFFGSGEARTQILHDVCIDVAPGQLVIMTGPSGSGKTTLLTLLGALRSGQVGKLEVLGKQLVGLDDDGLTQMRRNIGFIFQLHNLIDSLSAIDNVTMATNLIGVTKAEARSRSTALLERLGLGHRINYKPSSLSGGQRQRVAVARALVNQPRLILADEPTAALDGKSSAEVVQLLQESAIANGSSVLMVTHDNRILDRADRIVSMVDGRITSDVLVREQVVLCEMLKPINFFSHMGAVELSLVAEKMRPRNFARGDVLVRQGDAGDLFFLVREGQLDIRVADTVGERSVGQLVAGQIFGERALITDDKRSATVVGTTNGRVYTLDKASFKAALKATPSLDKQLQATYFNR
jgi:putative ABC transport system ATP-binding protein